MTDMIEEYATKLWLRTTTRAEALEMYKAATAEYERRKTAATNAIRAKLGNPKWSPRSWVVLDIGKPPENPTTVRF